MERPRTKKELRKLLGAFGYYREYIPHFAHIAKSLTDLTGKNSPNVLPQENEQQCAFELLRDKMCSAHVLRIPQLGRPYTSTLMLVVVRLRPRLGNWMRLGLSNPWLLPVRRFRVLKLPGQRLNGRLMPSSGPSTSSEILCMGQRSLYTATITLYSMFGSVLPRVLSCLGGLWRFKNSSHVVADWLYTAV